jgi:predicted ester cyclase
VTRFIGKGTFKNEMMGIAPTGKSATVGGVDIDLFKNGKVVESWGSYDMLGMLQQLGVVPSMTPAGTKA